LDQHVYDEKDVFTWAKNVRDYIIGQNSGMEKFVEWIEGHNLAKVLPTELRKLEQGRDIDPMSGLNYPMASEAMWSWLNLAIGKCASARLSFDLVKPLNGAEVWRKLVQPTNRKSLHRRNALRDRVQNLSPRRPWRGSWHTLRNVIRM
jgi:hypothetical protein